MEPHKLREPMKSWLLFWMGSILLLGSVIFFCMTFYFLAKKIFTTKFRELFRVLKNYPLPKICLNLFMEYATISWGHYLLYFHLSATDSDSYLSKSSNSSSSQPGQVSDSSNKQANVNPFASKTVAWLLFYHIMLVLGTLYLVLTGGWRFQIYTVFYSDYLKKSFLRNIVEMSTQNSEAGDVSEDSERNNQTKKDEDKRKPIRVPAFLAKLSSDFFKKPSKQFTKAELHTYQQSKKTKEELEAIKNPTKKKAFEVRTSEKSNKIKIEDSSKCDKPVKPVKVSEAFDEESNSPKKEHQVVKCSSDRLPGLPSTGLFINRFKEEVRRAIRIESRQEELHHLRVFDFDRSQEETKSLKREKTETGSVSEPPTCLICLSEPSDTVCLPCGHCVLCIACARSFYLKNKGAEEGEGRKQCILCKQGVSALARVSPHHHLGRLVVVTEYASIL